MSRVAPDDATLDSISRRLLRHNQLADLPPGSTDEQWERLLRRREIELGICALDKIHWFSHWARTYNPKLVGLSNPWLPFDLFDKQIELVRWIERRSTLKEDGHCAKSRDIGFTWVCGGYALHRWLFEDGYKANFGSRKAEYVDRIGDPDSIFEKIRMLLRSLPSWMRPGANVMSDNSMLLINEARGSIIRGEAGDDMGRGGRSTDAFYDEFAFVQKQDSVDAASSANSDCRIFGSTVNGMNNLFYRMQAGKRFRADQKFRFHWTDDPRKLHGTVTLEDGTIVSWERAQRQKMEDWKWGSEYDIDYASSVEGICIPAKWVESAKKLRALVHYEPPQRGVAGGDVGGGGRGKSVAVARFGALVVAPRSWGHGDTIQTASDMLAYCDDVRFTRADKYACEVRGLNYDSVGVGKGTQDALKRKKTSIITRGVNTGAEPTDTRWPDGETSKQKFANLKAELWWKTRYRFKKSHEKVLFLEGDQEHGHDWPIDECVIIPRDAPGSNEVATLCTQLSTVKVESTESGKIIMQSKKSMAKDGIASPDHADALVLTEAKTSEVDTWLRAFGKEQAR